jgi:ribulose-phosphate 3-epimerase
MSTLISPSILSADFANLQSDCSRAENAGADMLHVDVMDGHFVPNITIGAPVVKALKPVSSVPLDVHLMITNPEKYIKDFANAGSDYITIHQEIDGNVGDILKEIKAAGAKAGISVKPNTPIEAITPYADLLDLVLIMTVEPGFGGQAFMPSGLAKISWCRENLSPNAIISVDGGVDAETAPLCISAGATMLVSGSYIFGAKDMKTAIQQLRTK